MEEVQNRLRWGILATGSIAASFVEGVMNSKLGKVVAVGSRSQESADRDRAQHVLRAISKSASRSEERLDAATTGSPLSACPFVSLSDCLCVPVCPLTQSVRSPQQGCRLPECSQTRLASVFSQ